jgi:putative Mn2+ efflux pump MntP
MVTYVFMKYGSSLYKQRQIRSAVLAFAIVAFVAAGIAGAFGAFLNKYAPVRGGTVITLMGNK